MEIGGFFV